MTADDDHAIMPLGDHLEELRRRLFVVVGVLLAVTLIGLLFQIQVKAVVEAPLHRAIQLADPEAVDAVGLPREPGAKVLQVLSFAESPVNTFKMAFFFALAVAFPLLVYQLWAFVAPGLYMHERKVGFLMLPAAVLFFYGGILFGYFVGLPYFFSWLIEFTAWDNVVMDLRQSYYYGFFISMTLAFGVVMDIPWLVLILVKVGLVTPQFLASKRGYVIVGAIVLAAVLTPPDPVSQLMMFTLMLVLFESGLALARLLYRPPAAIDDDQEADDAA